MSIQPAWRNGVLLCKDVPTDYKWPELMQGGQLGMSLIVMTLAWWAKAVGDNDALFVKSGLVDTITDVGWVLDQLSTILSNLLTPTMHMAMVSKVDKPKSKRAQSPAAMEDGP